MKSKHRKEMIIMTNWKTFFEMIINKIWIIIVVTTLMVATTAYISFYKLVPLYEANTTLFVLVKEQQADTDRITYDNLIASKSLAKNYKELVKSRPVASEVMKYIQTDNMNEDKLIQSINVEIIPDSSILIINVRNYNPDQAVAITNAVNNVLSQKVTEPLGINSISVVGKVTVSEKPVFPTPFLYVVLSFVAGIFISLSIILLITYFVSADVNNRRIRENEVLM